MEVYGVSVHGAPLDTEKMINRGTRSGGGYLGEADSRRGGGAAPRAGGWWRTKSWNEKGKKAKAVVGGEAEGDGWMK